MATARMKKATAAWRKLPKTGRGTGGVAAMNRQLKKLAGVKSLGRGDW